ncbi:Ulp1-like peptidase [Cucumis melo var. makuwa]|uniref:Ulp1-like peptidase n=1 Tax=Cucumis melo var. makuwa TaxID=1194695 RepID=A0A5A7TPP8_CUCMM|nr:Ulp1-like peptidase [Cucumis melo var. makuwa]
MVFNGQLIHYFLLRQIPEDDNADGICSSVLGKNVRFTQKEFNIITGLWPTNNPLEKDCDSKRLQSLLFGSENKKLITCLEIEEIFKNFEFTNDDDAVKIALAVFIETVMVGKDKKTQFDMDILGRVDDEEAFKSLGMAVPSDKYFPATMSCQVHKIDSLIKDKLTKDQRQMFEKIIFGPLLNVNMVFNGQLIHHFLLRQIPEDGNADGICFSVLGKNVRFTQKEFNIITGLWPTNNPLEKDCDSKRLQSLLFESENKKLITCLEIEEIFKNFEFTNDDDAVKVALAIFIETVMVGKDKKTQFDMDILGRVDDEEAFKSFDWSTFFYTRLLNSLKTSLQGKKEAYELKKTRSSKAVSYYNIKGYVLAFQVWAYEVLLTANEHLATRNSKGLIPRILRWNCTQASSYKMLQKNIFDNKNIVVQPKLKMSTQEKAFMESQIRGDDNMQMEDDESIGAIRLISTKRTTVTPKRTKSNSG